MNIEIANRLVNLRKSNGLSQEALAEKLGISRQAVSKWERAEASPDTDNLILLARLYQVSLDELLRTEEEIPVPESKETPWGEIGEEDAAAGNSTPQNDIPQSLSPQSSMSQSSMSQSDMTTSGSVPGSGGDTDRMEEKQEDSPAGADGIHMKDKDGSEVHVGWDGIYVEEAKKSDDCAYEKSSIYINGKKHGMGRAAAYGRVSVFFLIILLYLLAGFLFGAWHPTWIIFLLIPLWHSFTEAVRRRNPHIFAYPVLAALLFLCLGFFFGAWHPGWVIFLTVPFYYTTVSFLTGKPEE